MHSDSRLVTIQRTSCCPERFHHVQVHVGDWGVENREDNALCAQFEGPPPALAAQILLNCKQPMEGINVVISSYATRLGAYDTIEIEEVVLFGLSSQL